MSEPRTPYQITGNDPRGYDKHGSERGARTPRDNNRAAAVLLHMAGAEPLPTPPTAAERLNALDMGAEALRHYIDPDKAVEWLCSFGNERRRTMTPTKFRAKRVSDGQWVEGWYVLHHIPTTDRHDKLIGYEEVPMLFNDEEGERGKGGYWHAIDPDTLQEVKPQLSLFN